MTRKERNKIKRVAYNRQSAYRAQHGKLDNELFGVSIVGTMAIAHSQRLKRASKESPLIILTAKP